MFISIVKDKAAITFVLHAVSIHALQTELASEVGGVPKWPANTLVPALAFKVPVETGRCQGVNGNEVQALNAGSSLLQLIWHPG